MIGTRRKLREMVLVQEDRDGLVVNKVENKTTRSPLEQEEVEVFVAIVHERIQEEMGRDKTTLPKENLQRLDEEVELMRPGTGEEHWPPPRRATCSAASAEEETRASALEA
jgi:hypothetical protein